MKRLWGIRHIRWWALAGRLDRHVAMCRSLGMIAPSQADIDYLDAVRKGNDYAH